MEMQQMRWNNTGCLNSVFSRHGNTELFFIFISCLFYTFIYNIRYQTEFYKNLKHCAFISSIAG